MADAQVLALLEAGVTAWNDSRQKSQLPRPDLSEADLRDRDLTGYDLSEANLRRANLTGAKLTGAKMAGVNLWGARLDRADLRQAVLIGADCRYARLRRANLSQADLQKAELSEADLQQADLRTAKHLVLDNTLIRRACFSPWATDPWSRLRRHYTGTKALLNLLLLLAFLGPYVMKTIFWVGVSRGEETFRQTAHVLDQRVVASLREVDTALDQFHDDLAASPSSREHSRRAWLKLTDSARVLHKLTNESWEDMRRALADRSRPRYRVWHLLLGLDHAKDLTWMVIVLLLVYNLCRGIATFFVVTLEEESRRSGYSPARRKYSWLVPVDLAVQILMWVSLAWAATTLFQWLSAPVSLPV